jgi:superfamily I DNA/RNA helicase
MFSEPSSSSLLVEYALVAPGVGKDEWRNNYLAMLARPNEWQRAVVDRIAQVDEQPQVPLRLVAAAGSGKSFTLVLSLANVFANELIQPNEVILTTFTRKAGDELKARLKAVVAPAKYAILEGAGKNALKRIGTFHSIAMTWLGRFDPQMPPHKWKTNNLDSPASAFYGDDEEAHPSDEEVAALKIEDIRVEMLRMLDDLGAAEASEDAEEIEDLAKGLLKRLPKDGAEKFQKDLLWLFAIPTGKVNETTGRLINRPRIQVDRDAPTTAYIPAWQAWSKAERDVRLLAEAYRQLRSRVEKALAYLNRVPSASALWGKVLGDWQVPGTAGRDGQPRRGLNLEEKYKALIEAGLELPPPRDYMQQVDIIRSYGGSPWDEVGMTRAAKLEGEEGYLDFLAAWRLFEEAKKGLDAWDYADALEAYWKRGTDKAKIVMVDEAQDNSYVQLMLAKQIADRGNGRFVMVGDARQAIYSWRGAAPEIYIDAKKYIGDVADYQIPTNYRSGRRIVDVGNEISYEKPWSVGLDAIAARTNKDGTTPDGEVVVRRGDTEGYDEAVSTAQEIRALLDRGVPAKDIAILSRTNKKTGPYEIELLRLQIPVVVLGSATNFFARRAVKGVIALLLLSREFREPPSEVLNLIESEKWGLATAVDAFLENWKLGKRRFKMLGFKSFEGALQETVARVEADPSTPITMSAVDILITALKLMRDKGTFSRKDRSGMVYPVPFSRWRDDFTDWISDLETLRGTSWPTTVTVATEILHPKRDKKEGEEEDEDAESVEDDGAASGGDASDKAMVRSFSEIAPKFASFMELMLFAVKMQERVKAIADMGKLKGKKAEAALKEMANSVTISTIHRSKGLEFGYVFVSATYKEFPSHHPKVDGEEEERLFYVACTRAADRLTLTCAELQPNGKPAGPSEFVENYVYPYLNQRARGIPAWNDVKRLLETVMFSGWVLHTDKSDLMDGTGQIQWVRSSDKTVVDVIEVMTPTPPGRQTTLPSTWKVLWQGDVVAKDIASLEEAVRQAGQRMHAERGPAPSPTDAFSDFLVFVSMLSGTARPGMSWADFATWMRANQEWILPEFKALISGGAQIEAPRLEVPLEVTLDVQPLDIEPEVAIEFMEIRPGEWRAYKGGKAVKVDGKVKWASRAEAEASAAHRLRTPPRAPRTEASATARTVQAPETARTVQISPETARTIQAESSGVSEVISRSPVWMSLPQASYVRHGVGGGIVTEIGRRSDGPALLTTHLPRSYTGQAQEKSLVLSKATVTFETEEADGTRFTLARVGDDGVIEAFLSWVQIPGETAARRTAYDTAARLITNLWSKDPLATKLAASGIDAQSDAGRLARRLYEGAAGQPFTVTRRGTVEALDVNVVKGARQNRIVAQWNGDEPPVGWTELEDVGVIVAKDGTFQLDVG